MASPPSSPSRCGPRRSRAHGMHYAGDRAVLRALSGTIQLVAEKSATLRVGVGKEGAETTLVGNDLMRSVEFLEVFPMFVTSAVSLVCGVVLLLVFLGWVALVGLGTMALVLTCTVSLSRLATTSSVRSPPPTRR